MGTKLSKSGKKEGGEDADDPLQPNLRRRPSLSKRLRNSYRNWTLTRAKINQDQRKQAEIPTVSGSVANDASAQDETKTDCLATIQKEEVSEPKSPDDLPEATVGEVVAQLVLEVHGHKRKGTSRAQSRSSLANLLQDATEQQHLVSEQPTDLFEDPDLDDDEEHKASLDQTLLHEVSSELEKRLQLASTSRDDIATKCLEDDQNPEAVVVTKDEADLQQDTDHDQVEVEDQASAAEDCLEVDSTSADHQIECNGQNEESNVVDHLKVENIANEEVSNDDLEMKMMQEKENEIDLINQVPQGLSQLTDEQELAENEDNQIELMKQDSQDSSSHLDVEQEHDKDEDEDNQIELPNQDSQDSSSQLVDEQEHDEDEDNQIELPNQVSQDSSSQLVNEQEHDEIEVNQTEINDQDSPDSSAKPADEQEPDEEDQASKTMEDEILKEMEVQIDHEEVQNDSSLFGEEEQEEMKVELLEDNKSINVEAIECDKENLDAGEDVKSESKESVEREIIQDVVNLEEKETMMHEDETTVRAENIANVDNETVEGNNVIDDSHHEMNITRDEEDVDQDESNVICEKVALDQEETKESQAEEDNVSKNKDVVRKDDMPEVDKESGEVIDEQDMKDSKDDVNITCGAKDVDKIEEVILEDQHLAQEGNDDFDDQNKENEVATSNVKESECKEISDSTEENGECVPVDGKVISKNQNDEQEFEANNEELETATNSIINDERDDICEEAADEKNFEENILQDQSSNLPEQHEKLSLDDIKENKIETQSETDVCQDDLQIENNPCNEAENASELAQDVALPQPAEQDTAEAPDFNGPGENETVSEVLEDFDCTSDNDFKENTEIDLINDVEDDEIKTTMDVDIELEDTFNNDGNGQEVSHEKDACDESENMPEENNDDDIESSIKSETSNTTGTFADSSLNEISSNLEKTSEIKINNENKTKDDDESNHQEKDESSPVDHGQLEPIEMESPVSGETKGHHASSDAELEFDKTPQNDGTKIVNVVGEKEKIDDEGAQTEPETVTQLENVSRESECQPVDCTSGGKSETDVKTAGSCSSSVGPIEQLSDSEQLESHTDESIDGPNNSGQADDPEQKEIFMNVSSVEDEFDAENEPQREEGGVDGGDDPAAGRSDFHRPLQEFQFSDNFMDNFDWNVARESESYMESLPAVEDDADDWDTAERQDQEPDVVPLAPSAEAAVEDNCTAESLPGGNKESDPSISTETEETRQMEGGEQEASCEYHPNGSESKTTSNADDNREHHSKSSDQSNDLDTSGESFELDFSFLSEDENESEAMEKDDKKEKVIDEDENETEVMDEAENTSNNELEIDIRSYLVNFNSQCEFSPNKHQPAEFLYQAGHRSFYEYNDSDDEDYDPDDDDDEYEGDYDLDEEEGIASVVQRGEPRLESVIEEDEDDYEEESEESDSDDEEDSIQIDEKDHGRRLVNEIIDQLIDSIEQNVGTEPSPQMPTKSDEIARNSPTAEIETPASSDFGEFEEDDDNDEYYSSAISSDSENLTASTSSLGSAIVTSIDTSRPSEPQQLLSFDLQGRYPFNDHKAFEKDEAKVCFSPDEGILTGSPSEDDLDDDFDDESELASINSVVEVKLTETASKPTQVLMESLDGPGSTEV